MVDEVAEEANSDEASNDARLLVTAEDHMAMQFFDGLCGVAYAYLTQ